MLECHVKVKIAKIGSTESLLCMHYVVFCSSSIDRFVVFNQTEPQHELGYRYIAPTDLIGKLEGI